MNVQDLVEDALEHYLAVLAFTATPLREGSETPFKGWSEPEWLDSGEELWDCMSVEQQSLVEAELESLLTGLVESAPEALERFVDLHGIERLAGSIHFTANGHGAGFVDYWKPGEALYEELDRNTDRSTFEVFVERNAYGEISYTEIRH